jgi:murein DD-endopeptidase MepM/ murein hydrolase activator NlpD
MSELAYYQKLITNEQNLSQRGQGEADYTYTKLLQFFRKDYPNTIGDYETDLISRVVDSNKVLSELTTKQRLRSPYEDGDDSRYIFVSSYGPRAATGSFHNGVDLGHVSGVRTVNGKLRGQKIVSVADGVVKGVAYGFYKENRGRITYVVVFHPLIPSLGDSGYTLYLHMAPSLVKLNQEVKAGTPLGYESDQGSPGRPHLHFEVRDKNGYSLDPAEHLNLTETNQQRDVDYKQLQKDKLKSLYDKYSPRKDLYGVVGFDLAF